MRFLGGLMFRADLEPPPGVLMNGAIVDFTLSAIDRRGNTAISPQQSFWICGSTSYGFGVGGTNTSLMTGTGQFSEGTLFLLEVSGVGPSAPGVLGLSLDRWLAPFQSGFLLIDPNSLGFIAPFSVDGNGEATLQIPIPAIPLAGFRFTLQSVFNVPESMTNGVELVICP
jgi:hypothetical protein